MRILILGGTGLLGHKMWQRLSARLGDVYVTLRKSKKLYEKCGLFRSSKAIDQVELNDFSRLKNVLDDIKPAIVINCAGVTLRNPEATDTISSITMNALLPHKVLAWCKENGAKAIHFSTVCVFDGKDGHYDENSPPNARDIYGRTKSLGDLIDPQALTIRSSFIGRELQAGTELMEWFLSQRGKKIKGFRRAIFTGVTTSVMADIVADIIERFPDMSGLYHLSSEVISKHDLLGLLRDACKVDVEIEPDDAYECRRDLDDRKLRQAIGFRCPSWKQMAEDLAGESALYETWREDLS
jgi:dTDP-4-dehydrorhamnose reductase